MTVYTPEHGRLMRTWDPHLRQLLAFAMTSAEGVPSKSVMSSSWCTTFLPGNRGLPSKISAKMQPMDQMSMAVEYFAKNDPHSSGARYLTPETPY